MASKTPKKPTKSRREPFPKSADCRVVLLSGGNPQIAKADGDTPVQAYIAAMPGWKSDAGRRLDDLIVRTVPRMCGRPCGGTRPSTASRVKGGS